MRSSEWKCIGTSHYMEVDEYMKVYQYIEIHQCIKGVSLFPDALPCIRGLLRTDALEYDIESDD